MIRLLARTPTAAMDVSYNSKFFHFYDTAVGADANSSKATNFKTTFHFRFFSLNIFYLNKKLRFT
jgi:hypothetical protein